MDTNNWFINVLGDYQAWVKSAKYNKMPDFLVYLKDKRGTMDIYQNMKNYDMVKSDGNTWYNVFAYVSNVVLLRKFNMTFDPTNAEMGIFSTVLKSKSTGHEGIFIEAYQPVTRYASMIFLVMVVMLYHRQVLYQHQMYQFLGTTQCEWLLRHFSLLCIFACSIWLMWISSLMSVWLGWPAPHLLVTHRKAWYLLRVFIVLMQLNSCLVTISKNVFFHVVVELCLFVSLFFDTTVMSALGAHEFLIYMFTDDENVPGSSYIWIMVVIVVLCVDITIRVKKNGKTAPKYFSQVSHDSEQPEDDSKRRFLSLNLSELIFYFQKILEKM